MRRKLSINDRWEQGIPHDPRSVNLFKAIAKINTEAGGNMDLRYGGDGDNGEELMYLLDLYFENEDNQ